MKKNTGSVQLTLAERFGIPAERTELLNTAVIQLADGKLVPVDAVFPTIEKTMEFAEDRDLASAPVITIGGLVNFVLTFLKVISKKKTRRYKEVAEQVISTILLARTTVTAHSSIIADGNQLHEAYADVSALHEFEAMNTPNLRINAYLVSLGALQRRAAYACDQLDTLRRELEPSLKELNIDEVLTWIMAGLSKSGIVIEDYTGFLKVWSLPYRQISDNVLYPRWAPGAQQG